MNELRWKNFDLNMLLSYSIGRHAVNNLVSGSIEGRSVTPLLFNPDKITFWEKPGDKADYAAVGRDRWGLVDYHVRESKLFEIEKFNCWLFFASVLVTENGNDRITFVREWRKFIDLDKLFWVGSGDYDLTSGVTEQATTPWRESIL